MKTCIGTALTVAMLLVGPTRVLAQAPVAPMIGDSTGSSYAGSPSPSTVLSCFVPTLDSCIPNTCHLLARAAGTFAPGSLPTPSQDPANPAGGPVQAPADDSNTTTILDPEAGLGALLGNNGSAINTTIVQQLTFTGKASEQHHSQCLPRAVRYFSQHQQVSCHEHFGLRQRAGNMTCLCMPQSTTCVLSTEFPSQDTCTKKLLNQKRFTCLAYTTRDHNLTRDVLEKRV